MDKVNAWMINASCVLRNKIQKMKEAFLDETGAVDLVVVVVLIGIAVLLAVVFKDNIKTLLETLLATIQGNAEKAVN